MASTNKTPHYQLPQYIGTDKPTFAGDINSAFSTIDGKLYEAVEGARGATDVVGQLSEEVGRLGGNVSSLSSRVSNIQTQLTSTGNTANDAYALRAQEITSGIFIKSVGTWCQEYGPTMLSNQAKYRFFEMGGYNWVQFYDESAFTWTGDAPGITVLNIDDMEVDPNFISTFKRLATYTNMSLIGTIKIYTDNRGNIFKPLYFSNNKLIGDNDSPTFRNKTIRIRPFGTFCLN